LNRSFWDGIRSRRDQSVRQNGEAGLVAYPGQGVYEFARWGHVAEWLRNGLQSQVVR